VAGVPVHLVTVIPAWLQATVVVAEWLDLGVNSYRCLHVTKHAGRIETPCLLIVKIH
jgi:hypothetical protein